MTETADHMTGPEHYLEAERLMGLAESTDWTTEHEPYRDVAVAAAQAHATLALTAATALDAAQMPVEGETGKEWRRAIAAKKPGVRS